MDVLPCSPGVDSVDNVKIGAKRVFGAPGYSPMFFLLAGHVNHILALRLTYGSNDQL